MDSRIESSFRRDRPTWLLYCSLCFYAYLQAALGPAMPFLQHDLGFSLTVASLHFAAAAAGGVTIGLVGEPIVRRIGRRAAHWVGAAGMAAGVLLLTLGRVPAITIAGAAVTGLLGTFVLVTGQAGLADHHGPLRAVALTESNLLASGSAISAAVAVGVLGGTLLGWRAAFWITLPYIALLAAIFRGTWPGIAIPESVQREDSASLPPIFWAIVAVLVCGVAVEWSVGFWGAGFLAGAHGLDRSAAAAAMGVFFGGMVAGRALGAWLSRRMSPHRVLPATLALTLAGFPLLWLAPAAPLAIVGLGVTGLGMANVYPMAISAAASVVPGRTDLAISRVAVGASGAILVAPLLLGMLADRAGIARAFGIGLPLLAAGLVIAVLSARAVEQGRGTAATAARTRSG